VVLLDRTVSAIVMLYCRTGSVSVCSALFLVRDDVMQYLNRDGVGHCDMLLDRTGVN